MSRVTCSTPSAPPLSQMTKDYLHMANDEVTGWVRGAERHWTTERPASLLLRQRIERKWSPQVDTPPLTKTASTVGSASAIPIGGGNYNGMAYSDGRVGGGVGGGRRRNSSGSSSGAMSGAVQISTIVAGSTEKGGTMGTGGRQAAADYVGVDGRKAEANKTHHERKQDDGGTSMVTMMDVVATTKDGVCGSGVVNVKSEKLSNVSGAGGTSSAAGEGGGGKKEGGAREGNGGGVKTEKLLNAKSEQSDAMDIDADDGEEDEEEEEEEEEEDDPVEVRTGWELFCVDGGRL